VTTLTVGSGKQFSTIASAIAASSDGDVIAVDAGTYTNDFATIAKKISLHGVGGVVHMTATVAPPNGKAILVTRSDITIDHFEFSGTKVADMNGAGIRYEGGHLTVTNSYFHDNQNGILGNSVAGGTVTIRNSEFKHNGAGDGYSHNLYVNGIAKLTVENSWFHDAVVGHQIKSRALETVITGSRITDDAGNGSYSIDLPNGGRAVLSNNVIQQGAGSQNPGIVAFGEEGNLRADTSLQMVGNVILNDLASSSAKLLWNKTTATAEVRDNAVFGLSTSQYGSGPMTVTNMTVLTTEPALDASHPWTTTTPTTTTGGTTTSPLPGSTATPTTSATSLLGTASADVITLSGAVQGYSVDLLGGTDTLTLSSAGANSLLVRNTEKVVGGGYADTVALGTSLASGTVDLLGGTDTLVLFSAGTNTLTVRNTEKVVGGSYADTVTLGTTIASGRVDLLGGTDKLTLSSAGSNSLTVLNTEKVVGGSYADTVILGTTIASGTIELGAGADRVTLFSGGNNDVSVRSVETVIGGAGNDRVVNLGPGARLEGGGGADTLIGSSNADQLYGGSGADLLTGGAGADRFIYKALTDAPIGAGERITDFDATSDLLVFGGLQRGTFEFRGEAAFTASSRSEARFLDSTDQLLVDANGDGTTDLQITLEGASLASLSKADFLWV
jgi:Ca2+-binding RTX toxin-like protein